MPEISLAPDHVPVDTAGRCASCPHAARDHDVISNRYCAATLAGGFDRGCVCPAKST